MVLIKAGRNAGALSGAIALNLGEVREEAERMVARAVKDAADVLSAAHKEREKIFSGAKEEGYARGLEEGAAEGAERGRREGREAAERTYAEAIETLTRGWTAALDTFEVSRSGMRTDARTDVLRLAIEIARKTTGRIVAVDGGVIANQMEEALGAILDPSKLRLRVCADDRPVVETVLPALLARMASSAEVELVEDTGLSRGSCVIEHARGRVDAQIETQLDRIIDAILPADTDANADAARENAEAAGSEGAGPGDEAAEGERANPGPDG